MSRKNVIRERCALQEKRISRLFEGIDLITDLAQRKIKSGKTSDSDKMKWSRILTTACIAYGKIYNVSVLNERNRPYTKQEEIEIMFDRL